MKEEFAAKIRHRCLQDVIHTARYGWVLYLAAIVLAMVSGAAGDAPGLFAGMSVGFGILILWRYHYYHLPVDKRTSRQFLLRIILASSLWGLFTAYSVANCSELPFISVLFFGTLLVIGVGGLLLYVPVFPFYLGYMAGYAATFSIFLLVLGGVGRFWYIVLGNLAVQAGLLWVGLRQHRSHVRGVTSSFLLERRARELETAYSRLERSNQQRVLFLENLASELYTSLDGINRVSEYLRQTPLGEEQLRMVESSRRATKDLVQYLEGIAEIAAIESGKNQTVLEPVLLVRSLGGLLEELAQQALLSGRSFNYRIQPGLPEVVRSDRAHLLRLVRIMAENSLRMTDPGGTIRMMAEWREPDAQNPDGRLVMRFTDNGVDMDQSHIRALIDDAYLTQNESDALMRGVSLHFALLGRILHVLRGSFVLERLEEGGNAYELSVPLEVDSWSSPGSSGIEAGFDSLGLDEDEQPRVLLVDENVLHQRLFGKLCSAWGYSLELVNTYQQAAQWCELRRFDIVVADIGAEAVVGNGDLRALREMLDKTEPRIPLIGIGSDRNGEGQRIAAIAGLQAFVAKPYAPDTLFWTLSEQLSNI